MLILIIRDPSIGPKPPQTTYIPANAAAGTQRDLANTLDVWIAPNFVISRNQHDVTATSDRNNDPIGRRCRW
jgi:hypothetical protein